MKKNSFAVLLFHWLTAVTAQQYSKAVNEQIARVENSLSGGLVLDGKLYTLSERMKHYNVAGLSVAVFDNFRNAGFDPSAIKKASEILSL